jgi:peroxiredoxin
MTYTLDLGKVAPNFCLKSTDEKTYSLDDFSGSKVLVISFTCNHCPYVIGSDEVSRKTVEQFKKQDVAFVFINSNSPKTYPEDSFEQMQKRMLEQKFPWIYLYDETQEIAQAYGALKTPHFFVFDQNRNLIYTGRGVDSPRDSSKITVNDLENALSEHLSGKPVSTPLTNPIGCNIKWDGMPKHWMPDEACDIV